MILLRDGWGRGKVQTWPYRWLSTAPGELIESEVADRLEASFPVEGFERKDTSQRAEGKRYQNFSRDVTPSAQGGTGAQSAELPQLWSRLIEDLCSDDYRQQVAAILDQDIADAVQVRLVRHGPGDWLDPHIDRPEKLFSHILYFNRGWQAEWGGCLDILADSDPASLVSRVVPRLGASALITRADNSWHQINRVSNCVERTRMSLLVHGTR